MHKRFFAAILCVIMLVCACPIQASAIDDGYDVGDVVTLGAYEQDDDYSNGSEDIEWIIINKTGGKILLLSKYVLDTVPYDTSGEATTWEKSEMREWLNNEFYNEAFKNTNTENIVETKLKTPKAAGGTSGGKDTTDKIFLLSVDEVKKYLPDEDSRTALPTDYAIGRSIADEYKYDTVWWRLRTPGKNGKTTAGIHAEGGINFNGRDNDREDLGVRPALWFDLDAFKKANAN